MLDNRYTTKEKELVSLVSFAYDLHNDDLSWFKSDCDLFPRPYTCDNFSYETKRIKDGIVFGYRGYTDHSTNAVFTNLGLTIGQVEDGKLNFDYAIMFQITNDEEHITSSLMQRDDLNEYTGELSYSFEWDDLSENERIEIFVKSMVSLGFLENDVRDVIAGKMTARDAYINIAPEDKKYKQWVDVARHRYVFENNVAISGSFGAIKVDKIPFPFEGEVIIDCSKAKTSGIKYEAGTRKIRLINIYGNKDSIKYAKLRNVTIDEVIDLSVLDATWTEFGHHKVKDLEYSIADLSDMNLTLACDEDGNKLKFDEDGKYIEFPEDYEWEEKPKRKLKILANVDGEDAAFEALEEGVTGVGLVRTETDFYSSKMIKKFLSLFLDYYDSKKDLLQEFQNEQKKVLMAIGSNFLDGEFKVRLLDFRINDIVKSLELAGCIEDYRSDLEYYYKFTKESRGAEYLYDNEEILRAQIEAIFDACSKLNHSVDIIVPYIEDIWHLRKIKEVAADINQKYNVSYRIGAMIENRVCANEADKLAKEVDFVSIGLNDLTESITGKSRNTASEEFFYLNDEIKEVIAETIYRAKCGNENIEIGICGEHTSYLENFDFFKSLEIDYISASPLVVDSLKEHLVDTDRNKELKKM